VITNFTGGRSAFIISARSAETGGTFGQVHGVQILSDVHAVAAQRLSQIVSAEPTA
jgi:hypothetical protein